MSDLKDRLAKQPPFTDEEEVKEEPVVSETFIKTKNKKYEVE